MKTPNILMVVCGNAGTAYWRLYNFHQALNRTGKANVHILGWDKTEVNGAPWQYQIGDTTYQPKLFGELYGAALAADVIVFQRFETHWGLTTMYALRDQFPNKPILAEIDDDVTDVAAYNPAAEFIKPGSTLSNIALQQFKEADGLIVSTPYLAEVYADLNEHIYVIPNSSDVRAWDKAKRKKKPGVRIGWIGGASHAEDLRLLETVIPKVTAISKDVRFVMVSSALPDFLKLPGVELVEKWSPILKYPSHLGGMDFDIGLAPLRDNKFNRAKSNLRWLEYGSLGIPCVASKVGHFKETIRHGVDGMLAANPDEMAEQIELLVRNVKMRKRIGAAAKARIYEDFNVDRTADRYVAAANDALTRPPKSAPGLANGIDDIPALPIEPLPEIPGVEFGPLEVTPG